MDQSATPRLPSATVVRPAHRFPGSRARAALVSLLAASAALGTVQAVQTQVVDQGTYDAFLEGKLEGVSLTSQGVLQLAPAVAEVAKLKSSVAWKTVADAQGNIYVGTGNSAGVQRISPDGKVEQVFGPEEVLARALALDAHGNLFVGTSPNGRVYRIRPGERPEVYFDPPEGYVWDLAFDKDGSLYVATGNKARIYKLAPDFQPNAEAEVWFESDRSHVTALALGKDGKLYAGVGPKALLVAVTGKGKGSVLFASESEEITSIQPRGDGSVRFSTFNKQSTTSRGTSGSGGGPSAPGAGDPARAASSAGGGAQNGNVPPQQAPAPSDQDKGARALPSAIYTVQPDGFVELFWSQPGTNIYCFTDLPDGSCLIGTDQNGRIFQAVDPVTWKIVQSSKEGEEVTSLLPTASGIIATTSNPAAVLRLTTEPAEKGSFVSKTLDAGQIARWGRLRPLASVPGETQGLTWSTRTGNTPKPDKTWTDWAPVGEALDIRSPKARYLQYRLEFAKTLAGLRRVETFFQVANAAPVVARVTILPVSVEVVTNPSARPNLDIRQVVDGTISAASLNPPAPRPQLRSTGERGYFTLGWKAFDPNDDQLLYTLQLKADGEDAWTTIADDLIDPVFSLNGRGLKEGYYQVKVTATDRLENLPAEARTGYRVSAPFLVDNTSPEVRHVSTTSEGNVVTVLFSARDAWSVISDATYTVDGNQLARKAIPVNGAFDAQEAQFSLAFPGLKPGLHSVVLEVRDAAGNAALGKATFESK